jgi:hypothetical protein
VRLPRVPAVLFHQLTALNAKFTGAICSDAVFVGGILPDLLFRFNFFKIKNKNNDIK